MSRNRYSRDEPSHDYGNAADSECMSQLRESSDDASRNSKNKPYYSQEFAQRQKF